MNIDLLPFSAFALESCAAPTAAPGDGHTLTVPLGLGRVRAADEPIAGTVSMRLARSPMPNTVRAGVVAVDGPPLTITF